MVEPHDVFAAVWRESRGRRNYSPDLHNRVDMLVHEWLHTDGGSNIPYAAGNAAFSAEVKECTKFVKDQYVARFGGEHTGPFGMPIVGFVLMTILGGIISWLVQRTLDRMFQRAGACDSSLGDDDDDAYGRNSAGG